MVEMLDIVDKPGCISKAVMRGYFERVVKDTPAFKDTTPLGQIVVNGEFSYYADRDTDTLWLGFAMGMRCYERVHTHKEAH